MQELDLRFNPCERESEGDEEMKRRDLAMALARIYIYILCALALSHADC